MAYQCPVCGALQADGRHLANHLAITASLHGDDHATWLDDHAPGWAESGPEELAVDLTELADVRDVDSPIETGETGRPSPPPSVESALGSQDGREPRDEETERVLREARRLTRRRTEAAGDDGPGDDE